MSTQLNTRRLLAAVVGEGAGAGAFPGGAPWHGNTSARPRPSHSPATWGTAGGPQAGDCLSSPSTGNAHGPPGPAPAHSRCGGGLTAPAPIYTTRVPSAVSSGMSCGAFAPGQRASACTIWRSCSSASLRLRAAQSSTASFPTFASSTCTIGSSCRRGFCSSGGSTSSSNRDGSSNSADGEVTAGQERRLEPGATPLAAIQPRIMMVFTCTKCDTRSTKAFSKQSYQNGVVLVRCPGCQKLHLVADHLGWFGEEPFVLHEHVAQLGGNVVRIAADDPHTGNAAVSAPAAAAPTAASVASVPAFAPHPDGQQQVAAGSDPADPGLAARTAAAVAAAVSSEGGLFELSDESQVRAALAEARELKGQQRQRQQPRDESEGNQ